MPTTRASARKAAESDAKPEPQYENGAAKAGSKRKPESKAASEDKAHKSSKAHSGQAATDAEKKSPTKAKPKSSGGAVKSDAGREEAQPSNIVEKGLIYFFTRGRVGVEEPESAKDLQPSYIVLRPIPSGAELGKGPIQDHRTCRLIALPKKVLPTSGRNRFMAFVEKAGQSMEKLKVNFFRGYEKETKTRGMRETPPVKPVAEGVHALTTTGRSSHLAYMLTVPSEVGELQDDLGLSQKGSFVISQEPKFGRLSWMPIPEANFLDYPNAQILLIGEAQNGFGHAVEPTKEDEKQSKATPQEELETLENEGQIRIEGLGGSDAIFAGLHVSKKEYSPVVTT
ncbi:hypothetical protein EJ06DRAFT_554972 [Trichodelitschia bisporula]|uniref:BTB domain transcription factor n=1 Tax=Trichodelitschia bisporula TaxID=703511 RepID=A0A6G1I2V7_9PEZI|nr:hypothetical protein EJ06DRAFT_554972 [Trichodelitschia bisporula]